MAASPTKIELFGVFPIPFGRVPRLLGAELLLALVQRFEASTATKNSSSEQLAHTEPLAPDGDPLLDAANRLIVPQVARFGELLFGEPLPWLIKEMWVNVLETGGRQALHNHANSFVSGVVYLTESDRSANTLFVKSPGGNDFVFNNTNTRARLGPYNADKWAPPDPSPGDLVLFPSYLLHEVRTNRGGRRISLAFNAIPERLDSWGYTLTLSR
jgi:putative 2-oxoglutarate-Fe(II)-dependent oxygenase superfamily protein